ncbi:SRPBCC domain-containing protein [Micromonospora sp. NPDC051925]|uniref:SRPBCC domain-containing protein n=1 Tax=Micromonospora sp. NPDC051925 TaxID=3364288 RepID=UPI0037C825F9
MHKYDIIDEAVVAAAPESVWEALVEELRGAARWWVPHNTFAAGSVPPDQVGGETEVTVHPKGVDGGGPKLRFTARTTAVEPHRRLAADYVSGVFLGTCEFLLRPLDDGRTLIAMHFQADPKGFVRMLSKVADIGAQHSSATQAAFANLDALLADRPVARSGAR